jgi:hypothetical protein
MSGHSIPIIETKRYHTTLVSSACDHGEVAIGEKVLSVTGDVAAILTATTTDKFLSKTEGLVVNEILCKPRNLTITRKRPTQKQAVLFPGDNKVIDLPQIGNRLVGDKSTE